MVASRWEVVVVVVAVILQVVYQWAYQLDTVGAELPDDAAREAAAHMEAVAAASPPLAAASPASAERLSAEAGQGPPSQVARAADDIEILEFRGRGCRREPALRWHIPQAVPGECTAFNPQMSSGDEGPAADRQIYGRISCENLNEGWLQLCGTETCEPGSCMIVQVVREGECGSSFVGFGSSSWRCRAAGGAER
mmetsp:Transcript_129376/g.414697  ORF Transcript_129376/g.414697 Transcript_129376/m.414697 type:complete len:195 (-) Transcript_129376:61-645(-)